MIYLIDWDNVAVKVQWYWQPNWLFHILLHYATGISNQLKYNSIRCYKWHNIRETRKVKPPIISMETTMDTGSILTPVIDGSVWFLCLMVYQPS